MFQDSRSNSVLSDSEPKDVDAAADSSQRSLASQPSSPNSYAEQLMDDLFQEVEQLLDVEPPAPARSLVSPEPVVREPMTTAAEPELRQDFPSEPGMPLAPRLEDGSLQLSNLDNDQHLVTTPAISIAPSRESTSSTQPIHSGIGRLLLAIGCVSVVMALAGWLLYQDGRQRQQTANVPAMGVASAPGTVADQEFARYLEKSLHRIEQRQQGRTGTEIASAPDSPAPGLPTVVIPKTPLPAPSPSNSSMAGLERIYVPVYQLPTMLQPSATPTPPVANLPKQAKNNPIAAPKPSIPSASQPAALAPVGVSRKLVGVLEQGENSVALFEINGVTQRYQLGESIGSSGWTVVEVSKNQAIIRRNGDVRSLLIGHSF